MITQNTPEKLEPKHRPWAEIHGTPWEVTFPKNGAVPRKRTFYPTKDAALAAIADWEKGRTHLSLGKRKVDELLYCEAILPAGVSITDACRFYIEHNSGQNNVTIGDVASLYLVDLKRAKKAEDYQAEMKRTVESAVEHFGKSMLFSALTKAKLLTYIKGGETYWVRYARKRAVSVLISKARDLEAIRLNPLDGYTFEDAPKSTPHFLKLEDTQAILDYTAQHKPELVTPFALQLFAGIRTEELSRNEVNGKRPLRWSDIKFGESITVPVEVSKTGDRRVVDYWPAALTNWLDKPAKADSQVCTVSELDDAKSKLIKALNKERVAQSLPEVDFRQNDFRRTYATHSVQLFGGEKTKDRLGHQESSKVLKKHYDGLSTKHQAEAHFALGRASASSKAAA